MNQNQLPKNTIIKLILKSVLDELTPTEKETLDAWLLNDKNRDLYNRIIDSKTLEEKRSLYKTIDKDKAYSKLLQKIETKKATKRKAALRSFYKYAAVIVIALAVGVSILTETTSEDKNFNEQTPTVTEIAPGKPKATLTLANGKKIDLEAHQNEIIVSSESTKIDNKNNHLSYTSEADNQPNTSVKHNTLYVPIGGIYSVQLPDGSMVWLNSNSTLTYPEAFRGDTRTVTLEGEAFFEVVKNKGQFIVKTENQDVTVLGTSFNVSAYKDENFFSSTLVEGKVKLSSEETEEVILAPGERGYLKNDSSKRVYVSKVDVRNYSSWKDGVFYFENEGLPTILKKVGRWYGFEVKFIDADKIDYNDILFTGMTRKDASVKELLEMMAKTSDITYEVQKTNGKYEILISKK
ncbi:FecR family protein [Galbibacter mesophilus]|uniref:FecR family protein n=1 Tax=Galbibacter mesophilus TaxID=379069 RepID=UPI00192027E8|nr:FecR family protein [Galbibacter mesophilus]MCM5662659.1 FecR domain-containing protein [Galbibacter mesophilus]